MTRLFASIVRHWLLLYFGLSVLLLVFASGVAVARFEVFPYGILAGAWRAALDWRENWRAYLKERPDQLIEPARFAGDGVTISMPGKASPGITLIAGLWNGEHGINLVDLDGTLLQSGGFPSTKSGQPLLILRSSRMTGMPIFMACFFIRTVMLFLISTIRVL